MIAASAMLALLAPSPRADTEWIGVAFRRERLAAVEIAAGEELAAADAGAGSRERSAIRLLDLWTCLDPRPERAVRLLESFDFADPALATRAPRLIAHRRRADGRLRDAHDWERRALAAAGGNAAAALLVAIELRATATSRDSEEECRDLIAAVREVLPDHPGPLWFEVETARRANRCDEAVSSLDRFARRALERSRFDDACWAHGLAAEIEARDLLRPEAARARCAALLTRLRDTPVRDRAERFLDWYARAEEESRRAGERRSRLRRRAVAVSLFSLLALLAACGGSPTGDAARAPPPRSPPARIRDRPG